MRITNLSYLEEWFLEEEFAKYATAAPDVDGWPISLLTKQQLGRAIPQGDHLVSVRPLSVFSVVESCKPKVR